MGIFLHRSWTRKHKNKFHAKKTVILEDKPLICLTQTGEACSSLDWNAFSHIKETVGFYPPSCRKGSLHGHYGEEEEEDEGKE